MPTSPAISADIIAAAIVAACKATGEDPLAVASGVPSPKARFYAFQALVVAFPKIKAGEIGRVVGVGSTPTQRGSFYVSARHIAEGRGQSLQWWSAQTYCDVCDAVDRARGPRQSDVERPRPPAPEPEIVERKSVVTNRTFNTKGPAVGAGPGKRDLYRMLQEAVKNTAKMEPKTDD